MSLRFHRQVSMVETLVGKYKEAKKLGEKYSRYADVSKDLLFGKKFQSKIAKAYDPESKEGLGGLVKPPANDKKKPPRGAFRGGFGGGGYQGLQQQQQPFPRGLPRYANRGGQGGQVRGSGAGRGFGRGKSRGAGGQQPTAPTRYVFLFRPALSFISTANPVKECRP